MPITFYIALAFPVAVLIGLLLGMPNVHYEMDHGNGTAKGTFFPLLILYQVFFYFIAVTSLILAFNKSSAYALFLITGIEATLFNGYLLWCYESYMHQRYPNPMPRDGTSNYSLLRYSIVLSLGFSAVVTFVVAVVRSAWK